MSVASEIVLVNTEIIHEVSPKIRCSECRISKELPRIFVAFWEQLCEVFSGSLRISMRLEGRYLRADQVLETSHDQVLKLWSHVETDKKCAQIQARILSKHEPT